jgi:hypothetical protein
LNANVAFNSYALIEPEKSFSLPALFWCGFGFVTNRGRYFFAAENLKASTCFFAGAFTRTLAEFSPIIPIPEITGKAIANTSTNKG